MSLQKFHYFLRDSFKVSFPTTAGPMMHPGERRRRNPTPPERRDADGRRPAGTGTGGEGKRCDAITGWIGAGVTGLAAAMYAARLNLSMIVLGSAGERSAALDIGGTITLTDVVENYPGFVKLTGFRR